jgi:hypothetical protein
LTQKSRKKKTIDKRTKSLGDHSAVLPCSEDYKPKIKKIHPLKKNLELQSQQGGLALENTTDFFLGLRSGEEPEMAGLTNFETQHRSKPLNH